MEAFQFLGGLPGQFLVLFRFAEFWRTKLLFLWIEEGESKNLCAVGEVSENLPG